MTDKGNWIGRYWYDNKAHQKAIGFDGTGFQITITEIAGDYFKGKIQDDTATGGTPGMGEVTGKISGDEMSFVKQMPVMTMRLLSTGERKIRNKKHGAIYYTGVFSADRKLVEGQWRIKARFVWFGIIPMRVNPGSGSWEMRIVD